MRVDFEAVSVELGGTEVLHRVSLTVQSGHFVGILGPNGSGKSTLLRTLFRGCSPLTGRVALDGDDVRGIRHRRLARTVAVMLQESSTEFDLTVLELVLLGRAPHHGSFGRDTPDDVRIATDALRRVDSLDLIDRMVNELSGGQKQRVLLARALAQGGPVLALDEPTNHLDISHQLDLMHLVTTLDRTVIAALHDLNLASAHCDEVAVLRDGELVAFGPPQDVLTPDLVREVFAVEARRLHDPVSGRDVLTFARPVPAATRSDRTLEIS